MVVSKIIFVLASGTGPALGLEVKSKDWVGRKINNVSKMFP